MVYIVPLNELIVTQVDRNLSLSLRNPSTLYHVHKSPLMGPYPEPDISSHPPAPFLYDPLQYHRTTHVKFSDQNFA
jgi:hypothetical protein